MKAGDQQASTKAVESDTKKDTNTLPATASTSNATTASQNGKEALAGDVVQQKVDRVAPQPATEENKALSESVAVTQQLPSNPQLKRKKDSEASDSQADKELDNGPDSKKRKLSSESASSAPNSSNTTAKAPLSPSATIMISQATSETSQVATGQSTAATSSSTTAVKPPASQSKIPLTAATSTNHTAAQTASTVPAQQHQSNNKPMALTQLLADYAAVPVAVRNIIALLQAYGPLTAGQIEYNIPPIEGSVLKSSACQDILQVLVVTGIVQQVQQAQSKTTAGGAPAPVLYCISNGVPRADPIYPNRILEEIWTAWEEAERSMKRAQVLKEYLLKPDRPVKDVLGQLLADYPEVLQDPVYVTALRNCQVDTDRRAKQSGTLKKKDKTKKALEKTEEQGKVSETHEEQEEKDVHESNVAKEKKEQVAASEQNKDDSVVQLGVEATSITATAVDVSVSKVGEKHLGSVVRPPNAPETQTGSVDVDLAGAAIDSKRPDTSDNK